MDKDQGKFTIKLADYSKEEITDVQIQERVGDEVILRFQNGDGVPITRSYRYLMPENARIAADFIRSFLNLESKG